MNRRSFLGSLVGAQLVTPGRLAAQPHERVDRVGMVERTSIPRSLAMRHVTGGIGLALLLARLLHGCAISPAEQDAIRRAWEVRDAERARECGQSGSRLVAGACGRGGGP